MMASSGLRSDRIAWGAVGVLLTLLVAYTLYTYLGAVVFGVFLYYANRPVHRRIERRIGHPILSTTATLLFFSVPILLVVGYAGLVGVQELNQYLTSHSLGPLRSALNRYLPGKSLTNWGRMLSVLASNPQRLLSGNVVSLLQRALGRITTVAAFIFSVLSHLFVMFLFAYYLLKHDDAIADWFRRSFDYHGTTVAFGERVDDQLETIFFGNLITIVLTSIIATATYYGLNRLVGSTIVAYPVLLGILTGIFTLIPVVGMKLLYVPYTAALLVAAFRNPGVPLWYPALYFVVTLVVVDTIPDFFIRSYVSAGSISMALILFAYVLGSIAFGWYGLFLGPIILVLFYNFARLVFPQLVSGESIRPE
ncbi:AI-2E family transporter [Haladaptatus salinisoli]|uniref:AI-2E family transporter n=1 Tax=Haladaptatus salinisoli TaxID=2884876 RepID=UPI001D0A4567|nr:AI-2E family transporter [Haladaptatus salinisoli]